MNILLRELIFINMSFFSEILDGVNINNVKNEVNCELIFGVKIKITGNLKIDNMDNKEIILKNKKTIIKILGENLSIYSLAKGEVEIEGNVLGVIKE